jgi:hypothetical protein
MNEVTLTIPRDRAFTAIAHLVLGGVAVRFDVTLEHLEDLQLAVDGLLERDEAKGDVTLKLRCAPEVIEASVGPFRGQSLREELEREAGSEVGLRRVLETVVDGVELAERDGEQWVHLRKELGGP